MRLAPKPRSRSRACFGVSPLPRPAVLYRRLLRSELEELEAPFVRFLAAQGIPADEWTKLKVTDEARADQLVDQFSDMVIDDVVTRIQHCERRSERQLLVYRCGEERLEVRGLLVEGDSALDLRRDDPPAEMMARLQGSGARLKLLSAERAYGEAGRKRELFDLLERGSKIARSPELFELLDGLTRRQNGAS